MESLFINEPIVIGYRDLVQTNSIDFFPQLKFGKQVDIRTKNPQKQGHIVLASLPLCFPCSYLSFPHRKIILNANVHFAFPGIYLFLNSEYMLFCDAFFANTNFLLPFLFLLLP